MNSYQIFKAEKERFKRLTDIEKMKSRLGGRRPEKTSELIEEVKEIMCGQYCKWPGIYDEEAEGCELFESDICKECPLNKI